MTPSLSRLLLLFTKLNKSKKGNRTNRNNLHIKLILTVFRTHQFQPHYRHHCLLLKLPYFCFELTKTISLSFQVSLGSSCRTTVSKRTGIRKGLIIIQSTELISPDGNNPSHTPLLAMPSQPPQPDLYSKFLKNVHIR